MNEHGGPEAEAAFLDAVVDGTFKLVDLTSPLRLKTPTVTPPHRKPAINLLARSGPRS